MTPLPFEVLGPDSVGVSAHERRPHAKIECHALADRDTDLELHTHANVTELYADTPTI